jgi:serine/threonine protein kinase
VTDPFTGQAGDQHTEADRHADEPAIVGEYYRITGGLRKSARGNVYRAQDVRDGTAVVIKQARALVAEHGDQVDTRMRVRNERRVLQALDGVAGVPRLPDHFRHADDEFLVTSDCGPASLAEDVLVNGPYHTAETTGSRGLARLARQLARIVSDLHSHGVIVRDLSPKNVVIGEGGASIVDFGISAYDGLHLPGATPGYAPARQWHGEPPEVADDHYALGMTLLFAASTLNPVILGDDPDLPRLRALQTIRATHGEAPAGLVADIADLLNDDAATVRDAFRRLVSGATAGRNRPTSPLPAIGALTAQTAEEITASLLEDLLNHTQQLVDRPPSSSTPQDASIYSGSSGIGLELLQHDRSPRIARILADLARFTALAAERVALPPGLLTGITGVSVFLSEAAACGIDGPAIGTAVPGPDWQPAGRDLISGAAGVGLGHVRLYQATGDPAHLGVAQRWRRYIASLPADLPLPSSGDWDVPGTDPAAGRAHGLAGVTEFLLALALMTGGEPARDAARQPACSVHPPPAPAGQPAHGAAVRDVLVPWAGRHRPDPAAGQRRARRRIAGRPGQGSGGYLYRPPAARRRTRPVLRRGRDRQFSHRPGYRRAGRSLLARGRTRQHPDASAQRRAARISRVRSGVRRTQRGRLGRRCHRPAVLLPAARPPR